MANINQTGYEDLTVADTAVSLASVADGPSKRALIYVETASIRWRADGTAPTATTGMFVAAGSYIDWSDPGHNYDSLINRGQFIRTSGTSATLRVAYFS